jgi:hypothetical protein
MEMKKIMYSAVMFDDATAKNLYEKCQDIAEAKNIPLTLPAQEDMHSTLSFYGFGKKREIGTENKPLPDNHELGSEITLKVDKIGFFFKDGKLMNVGCEIDKTGLEDIPLGDDSRTFADLVKTDCLHVTVAVNADEKAAAKDTPKCFAETAEPGENAVWVDVSGKSISVTGTLSVCGSEKNKVIKDTVVDELEKADKETENAVDEKLEYLATTKNGVDVYADSYTLEHMGAHTGVNMEHVKESIRAVSMEGTFLRQSVDLGRPVGYDSCVEVTNKDLVGHFFRNGRDGKTPIVFGRQPEPTTEGILGLCIDRPDGKATAWGYFYGKDAPKEPWDPRMRDEERQDAEQFWSTHALVYNPGDIVPGQIPEGLDLSDRDACVQYFTERSLETVREAIAQMPECADVKDLEVSDGMIADADTGRPLAALDTLGTIACGCNEMSDARETGLPGQENDRNEPEEEELEPAE